MILYSLRNLKMLQIDKDTKLTNDKITEAFQDLILKTSGIYFRSEQITSDVVYLRKCSGSIEIYWADLINKKNDAMITFNYYFDVYSYNNLIRDGDIEHIDIIIKSFVRGIIIADEILCTQKYLDNIRENK